MEVLFFLLPLLQTSTNKTPHWTLLDVPLRFLPFSIISISCPHHEVLASIFQRKNRSFILLGEWIS
jgi:hypothetical protein